jgi:hypothetical protein
MRHKSTGLSLVFLLLCTYGSLSADTLQGEFTFHKKAPEVALVYLPEDTSLSPDVEPVLDQQEKAFTSSLVVGTKGSKVVFQNSDSVSHNIFADDREANVKFDVGLINTGEHASQDLHWENTVVKCSCKIHPKMRAWVASISSKYYEIVDFEKQKQSFKFTMDNLPEELTKVSIWMNKYEKIETSVNKGESETVEIKRRDEVVGELTLSRK